MNGDGAQAGTCNTHALNLNNCIDPFNAANFCGIYTGSGTYYAPIGMIGDGTKVVFCGGVSPCSPSSSNNWWYIQYPSTISSGCIPISSVSNGNTCADARGNDLQGSTAGTPIPLTGPAPQGDPTCVSPTGTVLAPAQSGGCWANNWNTIQQYYATNPGEQQCAAQLGVTACLVYSPAGANLTVTTALNTLNQWCVKTCNPSNSTQVHAAIGPNYNCGSCTSDVVQTSSKSWYLWRMIADLEFTISPNAVSTASGSYFPVGCVGNCVNCVVFGSVCPDNGYLRGYVQNRFIPEINKASKTTSTRVAFGVSIGTWTPAFSPTCTAGSYQNCFWGILGVWIGGQGLQTAGCTTGFTCAGQANQQLAIYSCPTGPIDNSCPLSQGEPGNGGWVVNMAQLTNQTVQSVLSSNAYSQVYSSVDLNNLGIAYSYSGDTNCSVSQLTTCITAPTSMYMNIPMVFDVLGSYQSFSYQYPGIPPPGGSGGATITGFVYDANKGLLGNYNPIVNACIGVGQPCTGYAGQIQATTASDGSFTLNNVPPGVYTFAASAQGYNSFSQINVKVGTGANTLPPFYLQSTIPPGQLCLIPPVPNPVPFQPPIYGGLCVPTWVVYAVLAGAGLLLIVAVLLTPGGQALAITGAGLLQSRSNRRR